MRKGAPIHSLEHQQAIDQLIQNSFSDYVRKERRNLLFLSALSGFLGLANIHPSEVSALGLRITDLKPKFIYGSLLLLCIYFLLAFWLHADPEYRKARGGIRESFRHLNEFLTPTLKQLVVGTVGVWWRYRLWALFEYWSPIAIGLAAIAVLILRLARAA
jgi:hypothetical protein